MEASTSAAAAASCGSAPMRARQWCSSAAEPKARTSVRSGVGTSSEKADGTDGSAYRRRHTLRSVPSLVSQPSASTRRERAVCSTARTACASRVNQHDIISCGSVPSAAAAPGSAPARSKAATNGCGPARAARWSARTPLRSPPGARASTLARAISSTRSTSRRWSRGLRASREAKTRRRRAPKRPLGLARPIGRCARPHARRRAHHGVGDRAHPRHPPRGAVQLAGARRRARRWRPRWHPVTGQRTQEKRLRPRGEAVALARNLPTARRSRRQRQGVHQVPRRARPSQLRALPTNPWRRSN
eukprot:scaffold113980_cov24-Tisochrysis_lutea.AAC.7